MILDKPIILDDVIPKKYELEIEYLLTQNQFDWYLNKSLSYGEGSITTAFKKNDKNIKDSRGFFHVFLFDGPEGNMKSKYCDFIRPMFFFVEEKLKFEIKKLQRIRAVFIPKDKNMKNKYNVPHIDNYEPHTALIYYVNDNNGGTLLFKEKGGNKLDNTSKKTKDIFVEAKKGRMVMFNGLTYHAGIVASDKDKILININFI